MVGYQNRRGKAAASDYVSEHDIQFFEDKCDMVTIPEGGFYIAFPEDLHMTKCMSGEPRDIVKLVCKVKVI